MVLLSTVLWLFLAVSWTCLLFVLELFPDQSHLPFLVEEYEKKIQIHTIVRRSDIYFNRLFIQIFHLLVFYLLNFDSARADSAYPAEMLHALSSITSGAALCAEVPLKDINGFNVFACWVMFHVFCCCLLTFLKINFFQKLF